MACAVRQWRCGVRASDPLYLNRKSALNSPPFHRYYTKQGLVPADLKGSFSTEIFPDIRIDGKQVAAAAAAAAAAADAATAAAAAAAAAADAASSTIDNVQVTLASVSSSARHHREGATQDVLSRDCFDFVFASAAEAQVRHDTRCARDDCRVRCDVIRCRNGTGLSSTRWKCKKHFQADN